MANISLSQLINESLIAEEESQTTDNHQGWFSKLGGKISGAYNSAKERGSKAYNFAKERGSKAYDAAKEYAAAHPNVVKGAKIAGGTALVGATALGIKKGIDAYKNSHSLAGQTKKFMDKNGKKVAAGTLAALGAGVGVKALLKYLRKKKRSRRIL